MVFEEKDIIPYLLSKHPYLESEYKRILDLYTPHQEITDDWLNSENIEQPKVSFCAQLMSLEGSVYSFIKTSTLEFKDIQRIFMDIELILSKSSNEEIINSFEVCFFENMINVISNDGFPPDIIKNTLGPISKKLCRRNEIFWETNYLGLV